MEDILRKAGMEDNETGVGTSHLIYDFARLRSFQLLAERWYIRSRPAIRRVLRDTEKKLETLPDIASQALAAYLGRKINKADSKAIGYTRRERLKQSTPIHRKDPPILGQFRIDVSDPDFDHLFSAKAGGWNDTALQGKKGQAEDDGE